jgi:2-amino-4-hydroxy-6-hydroxymethyldihydropteridine diphosphokinase
VKDAIHLYAVALGSNRRHIRHGRPAGVIEAAISCLDQEFGLFDASPILLNKAVGNAGRDFANAVALIEAGLEPPEMLAKLKQLERKFGRRAGQRWGDRVLDLDLVAWSGGIYRSRDLTIPHPRLKERHFVLGPLNAVAPGWAIQGALTVRHLASRLGKRRPSG